jgi:hypothetical protein
MGIHAKLISDLKLVKELKRSAGRDDIPEEDSAKLVALVNDAADVAGPLLERIPVTFKQYTEHNIRHCRNLIDLMGRFIPRETLKRMNGLELSVLILSALLHDFGMFVTEEEKRVALESREFDSFLLGHHDRAAAREEARKRGEHRRAEIIEDALLAEYFRRMHPERARTNVLKNLPGKLVYGDVDISEYVLDVCESHAWGVHESSDPKYLNKTVSRLSTNKAVYGVPLNLQYIACCLRLADIMDFDRSRTPVVVFQNVDFTEAKSWEEWNKHLSVIGWKINEREVTFRTECKHPAFYVAVMEFLDWVDNELSECRRLVVKEAPRDIAERYKLHLPPVVDRSEVEMEDKSYLAGAFRFQLDYERIMKLLMDKSLYPDPSLFLRELLQNSLDACRNREAHAKEAEQENLYTPRIAVWDYSDDPEDPRIIFQDNGVGMSRKIVENYFMRVGRSYYRSPEFDAERARLKKKDIELEATSQFGIGILSCFMVADRFEVETYRTGHQPLHITIEGSTKYFTIKLLPEPPRTDFTPNPANDLQDGPPHRPGTRITVHLRPDTKLDVSQTLDTFAANTEYDINIYGGRAATSRVITRGRWEAEQPWTKLLEEALTKGNRFAVPRLDEASAKLTAKSFMTALTASRIPFEQYDFSNHLRGVSWFWLIRGEDESVCAERGYLRMSGRSLTFSGVPGLVSQLTKDKFSELSFKSPEWKRLLTALRESRDGYRKLAPASPGFAAIAKCLSQGPGGSPALKIAQIWNNSSDRERELAYRSLSMRTDDATKWHESMDAVESLLVGDDGWAEMNLDFGRNPHIDSHPVLISLHGILLPGGLLEWKPMEGSSSKIQIMRTAGGIHLDVRGQHAPVPAASRLFVDVSQAGKVIVPFFRAALRHATELAANKLDEIGWGHWFDHFAGTIMGVPFWMLAVLEEYDLLESSIKYQLVTKERTERLSRREVIDKYGQWAPLHNVRREGGKTVRFYGVYKYGANAMLLAFKRRRKSGEEEEVDMNSFLVPTS